MGRFLQSTPVYFFRYERVEITCSFSADMAVNALLLAH